MKQPKRLTRAQKEAARNAGLVPKNWMLQKETDSYLFLVSKSGKQRRTVSKMPLGRQSRRGR